MEKELKILKEIAKKFHEKNGILYIVGGYVRDELLGIKSKDLDIEMHNISFQDATSILEQYGTLDLIGEKFGIFKVHGLNIDFAFPRTENCIGKNHKDFKISINPFLSLKESAIRRDFTINSLMKNVLTDEIIDNFNGILDLNNHLIKHIDDQKFIEDPLRVLRACSFSSRLNFEIHQKTIELCSKVDLSTLSKERIYEEIKKALIKSQNPSIFLKQLLTMNHFEDIFFTSKDNSINIEFINSSFEKLDIFSKALNQDSNIELFMLAMLMITLSNIICNFNLKQTLSKICYKKELIDTVIKLLDNFNVMKTINENDTYSLKKLIIDSYSKNLCIKDIINFYKTYFNTLNNNILENLNSIPLNHNYTIEPLITGKLLTNFQIEPKSNYSEFLYESLDLQLHDNDQGLFIYLLKVVLLNSNKPSIFFNYLTQNNILEKYIPELNTLHNVPQNPKYHPEGSVYNHTMLVLDFASQLKKEAKFPFEFMFAALIHDFGKASATTFNEKNEIISYDHENHLEESSSFLERINLNKTQISTIQLFQKLHMRPFMLYIQNSTPKAINRLKNQAGEIFDDLLLLSQCDKLGSGTNTPQKQEDLIKFKTYFQT